MRVLLVLTAFVVVAAAASVSLEDLEFHTWKLKYGKSYGSVEEESRRKMIWLDNRKLVQEHNVLADQGIKSYRLGLNHFADMDDQEFQARFSSCLRSFNMTKARSAPAQIRQARDADLPKYVDWRNMGYVTEVKHQKPLNSCWAFSATGALEGQMFRKTRRLVPLSEQQLVDCSQDFGNSGYQGGRPDWAFKYIMSRGGLQAETTYPYEAEVEWCRFNPWYVVATCSGYTSLPRGDENELQRVIAEIGPISVAIDASRHSFRLYESGVYDEQSCSNTELNHAVLAVGYGTECNKQDYWLVKNSWGVEWGEGGYIKMARNKNNQCGIATDAVYPEV
ncbi:cathepsin L1-like [Colossoma macropomum]|uniref:cathepsin L1-like n=1 Tax=Colossoma macropomum TaxID=42526 RepID=UPI00186569DB|nr:cathepsin L1-like [Colossoma macropomum]